MDVKPDQLTIRLAGPEDAADLYRLLAALASFENRDDAFALTEERLATALSEEGVLQALIVHVDGLAVAMATFTETFATFAGQPGMVIEDIYVEAAYRHNDIGTNIMGHLSKVAIERGYCRIEWQTLLWNTPSLEFFESIGASPSDAWTTFRLSGEFMQRLADDEARARA